MKIKTYILLAAATVATTLPLCAQDLKGTVADTDGSPLIGAALYWADTNIGVTATEGGRFAIHRVKDHAKLITTFLGYTTDTLEVSDDMHDVQIRLKQGIEIQSVIVDGSLGGNYIKQGSIMKSENISFAGLCKMACCSLAESFENSASVTVGYSDAISGARQIKMLGLAGTYTQILDENRTIMRGLSAPYGLSYTPGMWLNSIQVSKGVASVTAGHEAITGQINLEHRKPTDDERLFLNLYLDSELRPEINLSSAFPVNKSKTLSTVILAHGSMDTKSYDHNSDGFRDLPESQQFDIASRWLYQGSGGVQVRWGAKYIHENRLGGQMRYRKSLYDQMMDTSNNIYGSEIRNRELNAYFKIGMPVGKAVYSDEEQDEKRSNFALVADYDRFNEEAYFGAQNDYSGTQNVATVNAMYSHFFNWRHSLIMGVSGSMQFIDERLQNKQTPFDLSRDEHETGVYAEYTYAIKDKFSLVAGVREDYNFYFDRALFTPRGHIKWNITPTTVLRASAGLGYRPSDIITDNIGMLATGRTIRFDNPTNGYSADFDRMEKALTVGGSLSQTFTLVGHRDATLSFDYFRTQFYNSVIVDQERDADNIYVYNTDGRSYTDTYQVDFSWTPVQRLDIFATFRYTNSSQTITRTDGTTARVERPLVSRYKTLLNVQYATNMRRWVFDVTAQLNGPSRIPTQTGNLADSSLSEAYPMFYAQVSRKIRKWDIYVGCENIADYRQHRPIMAADAPYSSQFNSSLIWGPLMGRKFYIGVRFNLY